MTDLPAVKVSNARIMDRGTPYNVLNELHISSDGYNFVTLAYYVRESPRASYLAVFSPELGLLTSTQLPYIIAEAPSNLLLKYAKPSVWQARVMVCNT